MKNNKSESLFYQFKIRQYQIIIKVILLWFVYTCSDGLSFLEFIANQSRKHCFIRAFNKKKYQVIIIYENSMPVLWSILSMPQEPTIVNYDSGIEIQAIVQSLNCKHRNSGLLNIYNIGTYVQCNATMTKGWHQLIGQVPNIGT